MTCSKTDPSKIQLTHAIRDYYYLINREYPEKGSLKLVADRYRLGKTDRILLYRGVNTASQIQNHSARITENPSGILLVDGYNVLLTIYNYRLGNPVFISTDHLCRDAGALFGKISNENIFTECMDITLEYLKRYPIDQLYVYLDASVTNCQAHRLRIQEKLEMQTSSSGVMITNSADQAILKHRQGIIASSDSDILDRTENLIFDIPSNLLQSRFNAELPELSALLQ